MNEELQALKDEQRFIRHEFEALQKFMKSELDLKVAKMETVVATMRGLHENSQKECLKNSVLLLGVTAQSSGFCSSRLSVQVWRFQPPSKARLRSATTRGRRVVVSSTRDYKRVETFYQHW